MDQALRWISLPVPRRPWTPEDWREVGSCRDSDPNLFYPVGRGRDALEQIEEAKAICRTCPSREPCLEFAVTFRQVLGIWGGTSAEERRQVVRERRESIAS
ncbi:MAG: WhiB family transcriptional regulator, redox-sensing transcriptional regulator [Actinomycetota bacterium]|jgi:WhiB family redox-sensing transcriptional regulator|nr:WhiB family transcriptional regulator, redox-sensing transcriptional regulator [Actinomycetota bacterium]